jgi:hypothetical protein
MTCYSYIQGFTEIRHAGNAGYLGYFNFGLVTDKFFYLYGVWIWIPNIEGGHIL